MGKFIDLTGKKINRLTVIERVGKNKWGSYLWKCQCECGNVAIVEAGNLTNGNSKSCGCTSKEFIGNFKRKHGMRHTRLYSIWANMRDRCYRETNNRYKDYGARGIIVCDDWLGENGFINFYNWAINNRYKDGLTIDRIDTNGNYCPDNCKWSTQKEQQNNRRNNHYVTIKGETKTFKEWCDSGIFGVSYPTAKNRFRRGWSDIEAITVPLKK